MRNLLPNHEFGRAGTRPTFRTTAPTFGKPAIPRRIFGKTPMSRSSWMATSQIGASSEVRTHLRRNASCKVFREACVCSSSDILSQVRLLAKTLAAKDCKYNRGAEQQLQSLGLSTLQGCRDRDDCGASFGALRVVILRVCCFGFSHGQLGKTS